MDEHCRVRPATERDLPGILEIERVSFSDPWTRSSFLTLFNEFSWVADKGGEVVGYLFGRVASDEAEILNLAVTTRSRRSGVGSALLEMAFETFRNSGVRNVYLEVRAANREAQDFYRKWGFAEQGRRSRYYDRPIEDAVVMRRPIGPPKMTEEKGS